MTEIEKLLSAPPDWRVRFRPQRPEKHHSQGVLPNPSYATPLLLS
ncbi:MAG TPA: hypothetical protein VKY38_06635 [Azoarcus sp.]|nr:hypothetical protein [Azoarcus sp.]